MLSSFFFTSADRQEKINPYFYILAKPETGLELALRVLGRLSETTISLPQQAAETQQKMQTPLLLSRTEPG